MTVLKMPQHSHDSGVNLGNMIVLSSLLHALILVIIFLSPSMPSPKFTFGPVYNVDLVSIPASTIKTPSFRTEPIAEKIGDIANKKTTSIIKKNIDDIPVVPLKRKESSQKLSLERKNEEATLQKKSQTPSVGSQHPAQLSEQAPASPSSPGSAEMSMKMRVYYSLIWSKIREQWVLPKGILPGDNLEAIVGVVIIRNGNVADLNFESKSGNRYFDESVIKAIKKASPFPQLPEWFRETSLEVGIRFRSAEMG